MPAALVASLHTDRPTGSPYLNGAGQICEDRTATIEEFEYDEQIHCKVHMRKKCPGDAQREEVFC